MSDKLREALELISSTDPVDAALDPQRAVRVARAALAADDAARGTMREAFEAWIRRDCGDLTMFGNPPNQHYKNSAVNNAWLGWQAATRDAAPQSAEPVDEPTLDELVALVGEDIAAAIDAGTLSHTIGDTQSTDCEVTAREVAVARALLFLVSGSALLDGEKKAIRDAGTLYRMVSTANNLLIGRLSTRPQQATEVDRLDAAPMKREVLQAIQLAYGYLWHINNEPAAPVPIYAAETAAYQARKYLRDLLTTEKRGEGINQVGVLIGRYDAAMSARPSRTEGDRLDAERDALLEEARDALRCMQWSAVSNPSCQLGAVKRCSCRRCAGAFARAVLEKLDAAMSAQAGGKEQGA